MIEVGQTIAHYKILSKLGAGGMGVVFKAQDTKLMRFVALKLLTADLSTHTECLARFEREARILAAFNHPSIATIYSFEEAEGLRFLVLEFVEGISLGQLLAKGPVPVLRALQITCDIAKALESAHNKGIVHRDLKPTNVMVAEDGTIKVLDFGLARAFSLCDSVQTADVTTDKSALTSAGTVLGTAPYMSPEQVQNKPLDNRTDIWAFGCVLYEVLSCRRAFHRNTIPETIAAIMAQDPDWDSLPASTPKMVRLLLMRLLEKDPGRRLENIAVARGELESSLRRLSADPLTRLTGPTGFEQGQDEALPPGADLSRPIDGVTVTRAGPPIQLELEKIRTTPLDLPSGRRHVALLFAEISGLASLSDKLDPGKLGEFSADLNSHIASIVQKYDGITLRHLGGEFIAVFGVPETHEDDSVRALRAALEILDSVTAMNPQAEKLCGRRPTIHIGIGSGMVITGGMELEHGNQFLASDALAIAHGLASTAEPGEILASAAVVKGAEGQFNFEQRRPVRVRGFEDAIEAYRILSPRIAASTVHGIPSFRARLIGRQAEVAEIENAISRLRNGKSSVVSLYGEAGTGKSRLVEEVRSRTNLEEIQWCEGHAYAYTQRISFSLIIDLLNRAWAIEESDSQVEVQKKIETGVAALVSNIHDVLPYIGSLYSLPYEETEGLSPELWRSRLHQACLLLFSAWARHAPTVIFLEDLHWSDNASLDLLRFVIREFRQPAFLLCVSRSSPGLFSSQQQTLLGSSYREIQLHDLSSSEAQELAEALLGTHRIPEEVRDYVPKLAEGNPFFLEEIIHELIDTHILTRHQDAWVFKGTLTDLRVPATVQGVIASRLDRLCNEARRTMEEASVIGRVSPARVLKRISRFPEHVDASLTALERSGVIQTRTTHPELEFCFRHVLTQEVAYEGLLPSDRREIHESIAVFMEQLYPDRIPEFCETLAHHFSRGLSVDKAVYYLMKSGEKSWSRYALDESDGYFREAYSLLEQKSSRTTLEENLIIDVLNNWAMVFNHRGDYKGLMDLLSTHEHWADEVADNPRAGMFFGWLGYAMQCREKLESSYHCLHRALQIGEAVNDPEVIAYACAWLTRTCADMGRFEEALQNGERATSMLRFFDKDLKLYRFTMSALGVAYWFHGDVHKLEEISALLLQHGEDRADVGCTVLGLINGGCARVAAGDTQAAIDKLRKAAQLSVYPMFTYYAKLVLCMTYTASGQMQEAEQICNEIIYYNQQSGCDLFGTTARGLYSIVLLARGNLAEGVRIAKEVTASYLANGNMYRHALQEYMLGNIYLKLALREGPKNLRYVLRNIRFLLKSVPEARRSAAKHFARSVEVAREIGAKAILGQALFGLGRLHASGRDSGEAYDELNEARQTFSECGASQWEVRARQILEKLEKLKH